jgi:hypothetical protein
MKKDDEYFKGLLVYAIKDAGSCVRLAAKIGASSGAAVDMWKRNGVSFKYRMELDKKYGPSYRKTMPTSVI